MSSYSLAIVGPKETILGWKALGFDAFSAVNPAEALEQLKTIKLEKEKYAIIFITETLLMQIPPEEYRKLAKGALPAIIPVPDSTGSKGFGFKRLTRMIEQAVGSDIFK